LKCQMQSISSARKPKTWQPTRTERKKIMHSFEILMMCV
jgi:hypothetical protein